jgi:dihydrofolate synthase/folylpolyglutamate synthase
LRGQRSGFRAQGLKKILVENPKPRTPNPEPPSSADILSRFCRARDGQIRLALEPTYLDLLKKLGEPHKKLPPVIHVAGTNGKGSVCAFLRAMLEAAGYRMHVYTSPHLVRFHERIRIAGKLIGEEELAEILSDCERLAETGAVSDFEAATAAAFVAFARHPADITILEVGMGGRLDATNVIETSAVSIITRLSYDHCKYLGPTLAEIAREKAGIMRTSVPCFVAPQPQKESLAALHTAAAEKNALLSIGGKDWRIEPHENGFRFIDKNRALDLPQPALPGPHQFWNAGLAIAALSALPLRITPESIRQGLQKVEWPARLQKIARGALTEMLPKGSELWLDGGHNDSAGEILADQMKIWRERDGRPLYLVIGMLSTKDTRAFLRPLAPYVAEARAIPVPGETLSLFPIELAQQARDAGIESVATANNIREALSDFARRPPGRILICGSLYLAGHVLKENGQFVAP